MEVFEVLADPTRREILCLLDDGPLDAGQIARHFEISKPAVSKHLKKLHEGALVTRTVAAQRRIYGIDRTGFQAAERWLSVRRRAWEQRLDKLEQYLESKHGKAR